MQTEQEKFMKAALKLAQKSAEEGEVPVGCVIVCDGKNCRTRQKSAGDQKDRAVSCGNRSDWKSVQKIGRLAAAQVRFVCDAGAVSHVRRCDYQCADSHGVLRCG